MMLGDPVFFDRRGEPVDAATYGRLHSDEDYVKLAVDEVGEHEVSTVWVGIDFSFGQAGRPVVFETLIFPEADYLQRSASEEGAQANHRAALEHLRSGGFSCDPAAHRRVSRGRSSRPTGS